MSLRSNTVVLALMFTLVSCSSTSENREMNRTEKGAIIGATVGALLGGIVKKDKKKALLFGIVGGVSGALVGNYMDQQRQDFEKVLKPELDAGAIELQKMPDNRLMVTMTGTSAFETDSTQIKSAFISPMDKIAKVVKKYGKTSLYIVGHTDNTGSRAYNQKLSEDRARAVANHLQSKEVIRERLTYLGRGEDVPRASNNTASGRQLNRRVDIVIEPIVENNS